MSEQISDIQMKAGKFSTEPSASLWVQPNAKPANAHGALSSIRGSFQNKIKHDVCKCAMGQDHPAYSTSDPSLLPL